MDSWEVDTWLGDRSTDRGCDVVFPLLFALLGSATVVALLLLALGVLP